MPAVFYFVTQSEKPKLSKNMKDIINDSLHYWEPRRVAYNVLHRNAGLRPGLNILNHPNAPGRRPALQIP